MKETRVSFPDEIRAELLTRANEEGFYGPSALSAYFRHAIMEHAGMMDSACDRRVLRVRYDAESAKEIEQYAFGKICGSVNEWLIQIIAKEISRNGLTIAQFKRIESKYGRDALTRLSPLALPLGQEKE